MVRTVLGGWAGGDFRAGSDLFAADFEWKQRPDAVEPGAHRGAAVGPALRQLFEVWENNRIEGEEYLDAGDRIVVVGRARGTAAGAGWSSIRACFSFGRHGMASSPASRRSAIEATPSQPWGCGRAIP